MAAEVGGVDDPVWWEDPLDAADGGRRRSRRRNVLVSLAAVLVVVAMIAAVLPTGPLVLPPRARYGPPGPRFTLSFPGTAHELTIDMKGPVRLTQYGTTLLRRFVWINGGGSSLRVRVWVDELADRPPKKRLHPFLRSYLPSTRGGRIVRAFGLPAATAIDRCVPGTGRTCHGTVGELVVLDGLHLFDVSVTGPRATDRDVLASFRP